MNNNWFEVKIRYEKMMENGMSRKVTESYLIDALSFTEAESRAIEELVPFITGEFSVSGIKPAGFSEVFTSNDPNDDRWFKCKLFYITLDEKSGAEKKVATTMLVQAADLRIAVRNLDERMKGTMAVYVIASVAETAIMDVYPYVAKGDEEFPEADAEDKPHGVSHKDVEFREASVAALIDQCPMGKTMSMTIGGKEVTIDRTDPTNTVVRPTTASPESE